jgi:hypothetical protein
VPVWAGGSNDRFHCENQRGSRESGASSRAWLNSLGDCEAFSSLSMREIRNGAQNAQKYLDRDARRPHLTTHQRDLLRKSY